jgi:hypothetical protein
MIVQLQPEHADGEELSMRRSEVPWDDSATRG